MSQPPLVTIAVPSANQGRYLGDALASIFAATVPVEVFVADAGSTDTTLAVIREWESRLAGWRSQPDPGQAAAINEGIAQGSAPYVAWLNSDDRYLPDGLAALVGGLTEHPEWPAAYGRVWNVDSRLQRRSRVWVQPFSARWLANRCIVSQPGALVRRSAWQAVGGLDESLQMAFDYDLWWRLYRRFGPLGYTRQEVAENRIHDQTKTRTRRRRHYQEAVAVVRRHYGRVPIKWWLAWTVAVWARSLLTPQQP
ncbi:MAG: glycosyltransferase [Candidatus Latescibacterota bacterium]